jgi:hypothetical protein
MKPQPNRQRYLEVLRSMTTEQKLFKVFELSEFGKARFIERLGQRFPIATKDEIRQMLIERRKRKSEQELLTYVEFCRVRDSGRFQ